jgi:hypothetical protein
MSGTERGDVALPLRQLFAEKLSTSGNITVTCVILQRHLDNH